MTYTNLMITSCMITILKLIMILKSKVKMKSMNRNIFVKNYFIRIKIYKFTYSKCICIFFSRREFYEDKNDLVKRKTLFWKVHKSI